jgi:hypothetical protein
MLAGVSATLDEVAAAVCVDPRDVAVLIGMYPDDVDDLWLEEGVLSRVGIEEVHRVLDPNGEFQ